MPNRVQISRKRIFIEFIGCLLLLLFFIPIKFKNSDDEEIQFKNYITSFNKTYNKSEYYQRLKAFRHSVKSIQLLNSKNEHNTTEFGLTKFSDLLPEEFLKSNLQPNLSIQLRHILLPEKFNYDSIYDNDGAERIKQIMNKKLPSKVDWREKNVVTKVKSQGSCGACWAFASVGIIESVNAIRTGKRKSLSVQNVVDCSPFDGCDGGNVCSLLEWMKIRHFKIHDERLYPLTLSYANCKNISGNGVNIKDFVCKDLVGSEEGILHLLANNGPVAVAINALPWQNYIGGVIKFHCDGNPYKLNHAVEIVGYDMAAEVPYYIVRNSWGEDFGDKGYLYIAIGNNLCGLAHEVAAVML